MKNITRIITDSGSDLSPEILKGRDIGILQTPIADSMGNDVDLSKTSLQEIYDLMRKGNRFQTSQPSLQTCIETFRNSASQGNDTIFVSLSAALTGTFNTACIARDEVLREFPEARIELIDSKSASLGYGIPVIEAYDLLKEGSTTSYIINHIKQRILETQIFFTVGDLSFLYYGGRLSRTAHIVASTLNIKPILVVDDEGALSVIEKTRGIHKACLKIVDMIHRDSIAGGTLYCIYTGCLDSVHEVCDMLKPYGIFDKFEINMMGATIGAHVGGEMIGFFYSSAKKRSALAKEGKAFAAF